MQHAENAEQAIKFSEPWFHRGEAWHGLLLSHDGPAWRGEALDYSWVIDTRNDSWLKSRFRFGCEEHTIEHWRRTLESIVECNVSRHEARERYKAELPKIIDHFELEWMKARSGLHPAEAAAVRAIEGSQVNSSKDRYSTTPMGRWTWTLYRERSTGGNGPFTHLAFGCHSDRIDVWKRDLKAICDQSAPAGEALWYYTGLAYLIRLLELSFVKSSETSKVEEKKSEPEPAKGAKTLAEEYAKGSEPQRRAAVSFMAKAAASETLGAFRGNYQRTPENGGFAWTYNANEKTFGFGCCPGRKASVWRSKIDELVSANVNTDELRPHYREGILALLNLLEFWSAVHDSPRGFALKAFLERTAFPTKPGSVGGSISRSLESSARADWIYDPANRRFALGSVLHPVAEWRSKERATAFANETVGTAAGVAGVATYVEAINHLLDLFCVPGSMAAADTWVRLVGGSMRRVGFTKGIPGVTVDGKAYYEVLIRGMSRAPQGAGEAIETLAELHCRVAPEACPVPPTWS